MEKPISVFISRDLNPESDFRRILEASGYVVEGHTCISLTPLPFDLSDRAPDWVFFASQNAVRFFFDYVKPDQLEKWYTQREVKWASIGAATARKLKEYVNIIHFYGDGEPISTARTFKRIAAGEKVLFPGAVQSKESIQALLKDFVETETIRIYNNDAAQGIPESTDDVLVFTSPLNVWAYFKINQVAASQEVVAIGAATAQALTKVGVMGITISPEANEACLAETVLSLKLRSQ